VSEHRFQVHLRGIIDLLSNHLYSGPQVFVRELLQNSVDAIRARQALEPGRAGEVVIEVAGGAAPTLVFEDDGIGLTEAEVHEFLATIGASSKRDDLGARRGDFIGQFGIGLLSGFLVADEITLVTRSARPGFPAIEWRGRQDGTYTVKEAGDGLSPGTRVYLRSRKGAEEYFVPSRLRELASRYGGLLPCPIRIRDAGIETRINADPPPWRRSFVTRREEDDAYREYGRAVFEAEFFDWIPLRSDAGRIEGAAFILPHSATPALRTTHRVYLRSMLLAESAERLLPDWAFFVRCVVNADDLNPTASRESFHEDEKLDAAREAMGGCLRDYLVRLAAQDPARLQELIALHHLSIKALAVEDDEFFGIFMDWLPFETSLGEMTFRELRAKGGAIRYAPSVDQFRQLAHVAGAEGICVVNAGYTFDRDLLEKHGELHPEASVERVDPAEFVQRFEDLDLDERERAHDFLRAAEQALRPHDTGVELRKFRPEEIPALYTLDPEAGFRRSVDRAKEEANPLFSLLLDGVAGDRPSSQGPDTLLTLNFRNPLVRRVAEIPDRDLQRLAVEMLYVQALLLGHHPLRAKELTLLNAGMIRLLERGLGGR